MTGCRRVLGRRDTHEDGAGQQSMARKLNRVPASGGTQARGGISRCSVLAMMCDGVVDGGSSLAARCRDSTSRDSGQRGQELHARPGGGDARRVGERMGAVGVFVGDSLRVVVEQGEAEWARVCWCRLTRRAGAIAVAGRQTAGATQDKGGSGGGARWNEDPLGGKSDRAWEGGCKYMGESARVSRCLLHRVAGRCGPVRASHTRRRPSLQHKRLVSAATANGCAPTRATLKHPIIASHP